MKKNGFLWWRQRMEFMTELFDGVRIDHFRGLESFFSIPAKETTAKNGKWVKGPGIAEGSRTHNGLKGYFCPSLRYLRREIRPVCPCTSALI